MYGRRIYSEGDVVLDPFAGSFTTALAAQMLGRRWIACDISEEYCKIGEARLSQLPLIKGGDANAK